MNGHFQSFAVPEAPKVPASPSTLRFPREAQRVPSGTLTLGRYSVRFARDERDTHAITHLQQDLSEQALALEEMRSGVFSIDDDETLIDQSAHHVLVHDVHTRELVGACALKTLELNACEGFATHAAFELEKLPERVLQHGAEVGRAHVAKEHQNETVLTLLFHGITRYLDWNDKRYVFGYGSLPTLERGVIASTSLKLLRERRFHDKIYVPSRRNRRGFHPDKVIAKEQATLPPLFSRYLKLGAKVVGGPSIDRVCSVTDYLLLLDLRDMEPRTLAGLCAPGLFRSDTRKNA